MASHKARSLLYDSYNMTHFMIELDVTTTHNKFCFFIFWHHLVAEGCNVFQIKPEIFQVDSNLRRRADIYTVSIQRPSTL